MKANEFVKKFGWGEAKAFVNKTIELYGAVSGLHYASNGYISVLVPHLVRDFDVSISDLKRLVESHEFINERGGLEHVKNLIATKLHWFDVGAIIKTNQAIADVESCQ